MAKPETVQLLEKWFSRNAHLKVVIITLCGQSLENSKALLNVCFSHKQEDGVFLSKRS